VGAVNGIVSRNRPEPYRVNPDDVRAQCAGCFEQKMITQRAIEDLAVPLRCHKCGGTVWLDLDYVLEGPSKESGRIVFACEHDERIR
jgi:hypothetical protein